MNNSIHLPSKYKTARYAQNSATLRWLRGLLIAVLCAFATLTSAQTNRGRFNPDKFDQQLQDFIVQKVALTDAEAKKILPLIKEMQLKKRVHFDKLRTLRHANPKDDKEALQAIKTQDNSEMALRRIAADYHNRFLRIVSPSKVYQIIKAEDEFHRHAFMRFMHKRKASN